MKHVALIASPHAAARIVSIDAKAAIAAPGVLTSSPARNSGAHTDFARGRRGCAQGDALRARERSGALRRQWWRPSSPIRAPLAEDAAELVEVEYETLPHVSIRGSAQPGAPWCIRRTARTCSTPQVRMGAGR